MAKKPDASKKPVPAKKPAKKPEPAKKVNKSKAVRDFMAANPKALPKEVSETLAKQGVTVSPNYVSTVKGGMKARKGKRKRRQQAAEVAAVQTGVSVANIKAAFGLLKHCGSIALAKEALAAAAEIQKIL
jgi:hypothetical protein